MSQVPKDQPRDLLLNKSSVQNGEARNRLQGDERTRSELPCLIAFVEPPE